MKKKRRQPARPARDTDALETRVYVLEAFCERLRQHLLEKLGFDFEDAPIPAHDEHAPSELGEASLA